MEFAEKNGLPILPPDFLISPGARDRWHKWSKDLEAAKERHEQLLTQNPAATRETTHSCSILTDPAGSPPRSGRPTQNQSLIASSTADLSALADRAYNLVSYPSVGLPVSSAANARSGIKIASEPDRNQENGTDDHLQWVASPAKRQKLDSSLDGSDLYQIEPESSSGDTNAAATACDDQRGETMAAASAREGRDDAITDTVGAIAVDCFGRIAAGSSSGGIGMKHRGRCGPAALVGIGTAVVPADPSDANQTCVATVTSGTGEHLAMTTAAATAADRIYHSVRRDNGQLKECTEDEAMHSIIMNEFMKHPGVSNSHCAGAIGILAVKKTRDGIYFYFGHNTDSFALASMHSEERQPVCTMSRSKGHGSVAQGGRVCRAGLGHRR